MTLAQLLILASAAADGAVKIAALLERCIRENRDPTPAEVADVKTRQAAAEGRWAELAPKELEP